MNAGLFPKLNHNMANTYKRIYSGVYEFSNLYNAYQKAIKAKRYKEDIMDFSYNLELNLIKISQHLKNHTYIPGKYHRFKVYEPKKREIAALPFRDRIVQHAFNNVVEPIFDKAFIFDSYACRKGKGTHKGMYRIVDFLRKLSPSAYCLKGDIANYFPSIKHAVLLGLIEKKIQDADLMKLVKVIIFSNHTPGKSGYGIPVGNLTSQLFANIYLNYFDYFIKHQLHCKYYVRYVDDFIILSEDKRVLGKIFKQSEEFLYQKLELKLNRKSSIFPVKQGIDFLGYRIWKTHRLLRKGSVKRMKKKIAFLKKQSGENISSEKVRSEIAA
ncbi:MAG: group II intron reverse transcriptase domain-containing protein, partial [Elusimicrobia bacterium]|nr:group II intron reverse transcriptase domain-containing protein [Elusimicrobiota bacterium]